MTVAILAVALAIVVLGAGAYALDAWRRQRVKPDRRVRVHLRGGDGSDVTIEGFLYARRGGHYILGRVQQIVGPGDEVALQGDVEVPEARVLFLQVLNS